MYVCRLYVERSFKDSVSSDSFAVTGHSEGCDACPAARELDLQVDEGSNVRNCLDVMEVSLELIIPNS